MWLEHRVGNGVFIVKDEAKRDKERPADGKDCKQETLDWIWILERALFGNLEYAVETVEI